MPVPYDSVVTHVKAALDAAEQDYATALFDRTDAQSRLEKSALDIENLKRALAALEPAEDRVIAG